MAESLRRRTPYIDVRFLSKVYKAKAKGKTYLKTRARSCMIIPEFVGMTVYVYNGKKYIPVQITEAMVGKKLGEFSPTRTYTGHGSDKKR